MAEEIILLGHVPVADLGLCLGRFLILGPARLELAYVVRAQEYPDKTRHDGLDGVGHVPAHDLGPPILYRMVEVEPAIAIQRLGPIPGEVASEPIDSLALFGLQGCD